MSYTTLNLLHRNLTGYGILRLAQGEELSTARKLTNKPSIEVSQPDIDIDIDIDSDIDSDVSQSNTSTISPATTWSHSLRRFCEHIQNFLWDLHYLFRKSPYDAIAEEKHKLFWDGVASPVLKLHWSDENKSDQSWITRQFLKKYPQLDSVNFQASAKCDFHWGHWCFNSFKSLPKDHVCDSHRSLVHLQSIAQELYLKDAKFYYAADDTSAEVEVEAGTFVDDDIEAINQMGSSVRMREFGVSTRLQTIRAIRHYFVAPINAIIDFFRPTWLWYPVKYITDVLVWPASTPWTCDVLIVAGLWNIGRALFAPTLVQVLVGLASTVIQHFAALSLRDELCEQNTHYGRLTRAVVFGSMIAWYYKTNGIYGVSFLVGVGLAELSPCRDWYYGL